jgi:hypothetical protein
MGSVEERRKKDDEARQRRRGRSWLWFLRGLTAFVFLVVAVVLLLFLGVIGYWERDGYCARCLQHAIIDEYRALGASVHSSRRLTDRVHHVVRQIGLHESKCSPGVYEQIHGVACRHEFMFRSGRRMSCRATAPSLAPYNGPYHARLGAIAGLYHAFGHAGDSETARALYEVADRAYPISDYDYSGMLDVSELFLAAVKGWQTSSELDRRADLYRDSGIPLTHTALTLAEMVLRLRDVETPADFRQVLDDFKPRLKPAVVEE